MSRHEGRVLAMQVLFSHYYTPLAINQLDKFNSLIDQDLPEFSLELVTKTMQELNSIDSKIKSLAKNWKFERIHSIDLAILRLAIFEIIFLKTPKNIVIDEYLIIAKKFSTEDAYKFINGILDSPNLLK
jgi:N utilization substance protein B